jgi:hypothetical protein
LPDKVIEIRCKAAAENRIGLSGLDIINVVPEFLGSHQMVIFSNDLRIGNILLDLFFENAGCVMAEDIVRADNIVPSIRPCGHELSKG